MHFRDEDISDARARHEERRDQFAAAAGDKLQAAEDCQFSLLPYKELEQTAQRWYAGTTEGMARANWGPLDDFIRAQVRRFAEQGFELADVLQMLRLLRTVAIESEGWTEGELEEVDSIINEAFEAQRGQAGWQIPEGLNYLTGKGRVERAREAAEAGKSGQADRRARGRNQLKMPIRVRGFMPKGPIDEITTTANVSRTGLYFVTTQAYFQGAHVTVFYPFWDYPGAINTEYRAEVARVDEMDERRGVALKFLSSLGSRLTSA